MSAAILGADVSNKVRSAFSVSLDGATGYVGFANFGVGTAVSVAGWVYTTSWPATAALWINKDVELRIDAGDTLRFWPDINLSAISAAGLGLSTSAWHHVAVTHADAGPTTVLYVDGLAAASTGNEHLLNNGGNFQTPARLGNGDGAFNGLMDDWRVYGRVLSAAEVGGLAAGRNVTGGLLAYWPFEEGSGTTTADASGGGETGTFNPTVTWSTNVPSQI